MGKITLELYLSYRNLVVCPVDVPTGNVNYNTNTAQTVEQLLATGQNVDSAMTVALKHCDAAFVVFKKDINTTTCFENPNIEELTFNINGKYYPRESIKCIQ